MELSSFISEPRYLKLVTVSSFCLFTLISVLMPLVLFFHQLGLLSTDLHAVVEALLRQSTNFASSSSSPAKPSMSSAKRRLVIFLPSILGIINLKLPSALPRKPANHQMLQKTLTYTSELHLASEPCQLLIILLS